MKIRRKSRRRATTIVTTHCCYKCGYRLDAHSVPGGARKDAPREGDWSLCLNCCAPLILGADLIGRKPKKAQLAAMDDGVRAQVARLRAVIQQVNAMRMKNGQG